MYLIINSHEQKQRVAFALYRQNKTDKLRKRRAMKFTWYTPTSSDTTADPPYPHFRCRTTSYSTRVPLFDFFTIASMFGTVKVVNINSRRHDKTSYRIYNIPLRRPLFRFSQIRYCCIVFSETISHIVFG